MDNKSVDLEFFDFENASEEEIKEIQAILKGPGNNGSVELPWKTLQNSSAESLAQNEKEGPTKKSASAACNNNGTGTVDGEMLHLTPQNPSPPVVRMPPPTNEAFIAPPTSVGPYPNSPYLVSRTIPYLRAYPHMGMPFFACPIPGAAGETPYGQFVPVIPATVGQETRVDSESSQKVKTINKQLCLQSEKKDYSSALISETSRESRQEDEHFSVSSPTSKVNSPTSVPIVPLPVPQPTFGVTGGTIPLHGYPPGLHTLPYTPIAGTQQPSPAMYYVPVFNHPYSSYLPSPAAPIVLPVNLRPETDKSSPVNTVVPPASVAKPSEVIQLVQTKDEHWASPNQCSVDKEINPLSVDKEINPLSVDKEINPLSVDKEMNSLSVDKEINPLSVNQKINPLSVDQEINPLSVDQEINPLSVDKEINPLSVGKEINPLTVDSAAKSVSEGEDIDCSSTSDCPVSLSPSSDCPATIAEGCSNSKCAPKDAKQTTRCWADLFKKPVPEVNGIDCRLVSQQRHRSGKGLLTNEKDNVAPSDIH